MGYHHNLPHSLVFTPHNIGRVQLCNLIYEQGAQQMIILLQHICAKTPLGKAMELLIHTYQLWAGLQQHVMIVTQPCLWIPNHWLSQLRATMHANQLQVHYDAWNILPLHHHN